MSEHKYSYVSEADDHFVVSHPSDGQFKVAKKGISKALQKRIQALPKSMAEGGEVDDETQSSGTPDYPTAGDKVYGGVDAYGDPLPPTERQIEAANAPKKSMFGDITNPNVDPSQYAAPKEQGPTGNPNIKGAAFTPVFPEEPNRVVEAPQQAPKQQNQPAQNPFASVNPMDRGYKEIESGMNAAAAAQKAQNDQIAEVYRKDQETQAAQNYAHSNALYNANLETDRLTQDVANSTIDPKRFWHQMGTANKISAAIGLFLGGIGAAQTGGQNQALGIINKSIEQDIDAQKADLGKKENLLSMNLRKTGDLNAAYNQTKLQQSAAVMGQLQQIQATTNNPIVAAKTKEAIGQLHLQMDQQKMQVAQTQFWNGVATRQVPLRAR